MKKLPLHLRIILGMLLGVICGAVFTKFENGNAFILDCKAFGTIFINALKLIAMPLIISSLIKGFRSQRHIKTIFDGWENDWDISYNYHYCSFNWVNNSKHYSPWKFNFRIYPYGFNRCL